jgi:hypothetical protein
MEEHLSVCADYKEIQGFALLQVVILLPFILQFCTGFRKLDISKLGF